MLRVDDMLGHMLGQAILFLYVWIKSAPFLTAGAESPKVVWCRRYFDLTMQGLFVWSDN